MSQPADSTLGEYVFTGFVISRHRQLMDGWGQPFKKVLSLSPCIGTVFPASWAFGWGQGETAAAHDVRDASAFGVQDLAVLQREVNQWHSRGAMVFDSFMLTDACVTALRKLLPTGSDVYVLGAALHKDDVSRLLGELSMDGPEPTLGEVLRQGRNVPEGGRPLGFELLVADKYSFNGHSWICNGIDETFDGAGQVERTHLGFIPTRGAAVEWAARIQTENLGEPGLWLPWLVIDYTGKRL